MDLFSIIIGILILLLGVFFCFGGFKFFRWLLPLFGFLLGFWVGEGIVAALLEYTTTNVVIGWIVGLIFGFLLAGLSYFLFKAGVAILGGLFGFWITTAVVTAVGLENVLFVLLLGLVGAIIFALLTLQARLQLYLIIGITAMFGAVIFLTGFAMIAGVITLEQFRANTFVMRSIMDSSPLWLLLWLILLLIGFVWQYRSAKGRELAQW